MNYHIYFYAPKNHLDTVKNAMFAAGAGNIGNYSHCCWQTKGMGQFLPTDAADPFVGTANELSVEEEYKVEMICRSGCLKKVLTAMKQAHPYEEPAYGIIKLENYSS